MTYMGMVVMAIALAGAATSYAAEDRPPDQAFGGLYAEERNLELSLFGFTLRSFKMSASSMLPTMTTGELFLVIPVDRPVARGDVVVFKPPGDKQVDYVKRVVGLPGDTIEMANGILRINGSDVTRAPVESFEVKRQDNNARDVPQYVETLPNGRRHLIIEMLGDKGPGDNMPETLVPEGHYFVMGDNRDNSRDSRYPLVGFVPARNIGYFVWRMMRPGPVAVDAEFQ